MPPAATNSTRAAPGQSPADLLAAAVTYRYTAILAGQGPELDESALIQFRALGNICQAVAKLRRGEQNAARLKMEIERWELEREELRAENQEAERSRLRAALSARFMTAMKVTEWYNKLGGGPLAVIAAGVLREIQMCQDPAHFHSDIIGNRTPAELDRWVKEQVKKAPPRKTEIESAAEACRQMDAALGIGKDGEMTSRPRRRSKPHRRPRHRVAPRSHRVHKVHKVHTVHPAPPPADPPAHSDDVAEDVVSSVPLDPAPALPAIGANPSLNPDQIVPNQAYLAILLTQPSPRCSVARCWKTTQNPCSTLSNALRAKSNVASTCLNCVGRKGSSVRIVAGAKFGRCKAVVGCARDVVTRFERRRARFFKTRINPCACGFD